VEGLMLLHLRPAIAVTALLVPLWAAPAPPAAACAFDSGSAGLFDSNFVAVHPQASVVYFAIVDAVEQGVLDRSAFQAIAPGSSGYWRAVGRLNGLHRLLSAASASRATPAISLLFIESNLWARFEPGPQGLGISVHTPGAGDGDAVIFTSEAGIAAVLDGRLPVKVALDRGLIAVDGASSAGDKTRELILAALDAPDSSTAGAVSGQGAPVRFFGPTR
jgi:hypothetical protein